MIKYLPLLIAVIFFACHEAKVTETSDTSSNGIIVSSDLNHFYNAFDAIHQTSDSLKRLDLLQELFLEKASPGQNRMIEARNYQPHEYVTAMTTQKAFWSDLRKNTEKLEIFNTQLLNGVEKIKGLYKNHKSTTLYYTIGCHRSPGTGVPGMVMIGSEFALGDTTMNVEQLRPYNQGYYKMNPVDHLELLIVHEYVHTQQGEMVHNLLCLTLYEGIAEFVAQLVTKKESPFKAFTYGPEHEDYVREQFEIQMYNPGGLRNWLWNSDRNLFGTADMSYYVGYRIASLYYDQAEDKEKALAELIELDLNDDPQVTKIVESSGYLTKGLDELYSNFEKNRPRVVRIEGFPEDFKNIDPVTNTITIHFSEPMNPDHRGFDYGPIGESGVLRVTGVKGFSDDQKSLTVNIELLPGHHHQMLITNRFISETGYALEPYLLDVETKTF